MNFNKFRLILGIFFLLTMVYGLSTVLAQERTITLDISVTNPSDEETQEVEVRADLPKELKERDVISSDGLEVGFDTEKGSLFVAGKVLLQPAETTIYKIKVRDAWVIPEKQITEIRRQISEIRGQRTEDRGQIEDRLDKILARQKESTDNIGARIAAYRENEKELGAVRSALGALREELKRKTQDVRYRAQNAILIGILAVFFGAVVFISLKKREYLTYLRNKMRLLGIGERRRFVRIPNQAEVVEYRLLPQEQIDSSSVTKDISQGGVSFSLDKAYSPKSVIELKIKLPTYAENLVFRGFIAWQKKVTPRGRKEYYLTGISFGEVEKKEDYQKLKEFIEQKRGGLNKLLRRSSY